MERVARKQKRAPPATPARVRPGLTSQAKPEPMAGAAPHPSFVMISSVFVGNKAVLLTSALSTYYVLGIYLLISSHSNPEGSYYYHPILQLRR